MDIRNKGGMFSSSSSESHHHRGSRVVIGVLSLSFLLTIIAKKTIINTFALQPGLLFTNYYIWSLISWSFIDSSIISAALNIFFVVLLSSPYERTIGTPFFFRLLLLLSLIISIHYYIISIICWWIKFDDQCIFVSLSGFSALTAALMMGWKQKFPDRSIFPNNNNNTRLISDLLKWRYIPSYLILFSLIIHFSSSPNSHSHLHSWLLLTGFFYSWIYLRFFASDSITGAVGDLRSDFSFASFFPDIPQLRAIIDFISAIIFKSALSIGLFHDAVKSYELLQSQSHQSATLLSSVVIGGTGGNNNNSSSSSSSSTSSILSALSSDPHAERRRQLAIKAIDEKLAELSRAPLPASALDPELHDLDPLMMNHEEKAPLLRDYENVSVDELNDELSQQEAALKTAQAQTMQKL